MAKAVFMQYQALEKGGPFTTKSIPKPVPGPDEVCIRLKAVALNPLDCKKLYMGHMIKSWPAVLGIDGAGVIDAVGENISNFKVGDEVFSLFGHESRSASFQEIAIVPEMFVAQRPSNLTYEEAASLPICFCTAAAAIYSSLKIPLPFLRDGATSGPQPKSILVLGGSSGVGAAAIQILHIALPTAAIITTSSPRHYAHLTRLGATKCFHQTSPSLVSDIKSATPDSMGVDMIVDAVGSGASEKNIYETLSPTGSREVAEVVTGARTQIPDGVKKTMALGRQVFDRPGGQNIMTALSSLVSEGKYQAPNHVEVVGHGFDAIAKGLQTLKGGVSGTKLVVIL